MQKWFVTWNRTEYKEWASAISGGYLLVILRKEQTRYLCVKAKLVMGNSGLPAFIVVEERYATTASDGMQQMETWKK